MRRAGHHFGIEEEERLCLPLSGRYGVSEWYQVLMGRNSFDHFFGSHGRFVGTRVLIQSRILQHVCATVRGFDRGLARMGRSQGQQ